MGRMPEDKVRAFVGEFLERDKIRAEEEAEEEGEAKE